MDAQAFFALHKDLPREGPGLALDVDWALELARIAPDAVLCDAGAGPGGDLAALLAHVPQGRVLAVDTHAPFVATIRARFATEPRVSARVCDMADLADQPEAPFDLIWCAGALYFLGTEVGLRCFAPALKPGGVVAFSAPCFFTPDPSEDARAFWAGEEAQIVHADVLCRQVRAAGYSILSLRPLSDAAWDAYFEPLKVRIDSLRATADTALGAVLDGALAEADHWSRVRDETGYLLIVARKE